MSENENSDPKPAAAEPAPAETPAPAMPDRSVQAPEFELCQGSDGSKDRAPRITGRRRGD